MNDDLIAKADDIIKKKAGTGNEGYCVLALIDEKGFPTASTLSVSKADGINCLTFCVELEGNKAKRIEKCNRASVCFNDIDYNITLIGTIEILTDPEIKKEMWYEGLEHHFKGIEDPNYCVLRFKTLRYNLFIDWKHTIGEF
jgi:general stress protein 26